MSSTVDTLITHAVKNVWCSPDQDNQYTLKPGRVSPLHGGVVVTLPLMGSYIPLPNKTSRFHTFMIGRINPAFLGLNDLWMDWVSAQVHCNTRAMIIDVYTKSGVQIPKSRVYFLGTMDSNLLVAVEDTPEVANIGAEPIYVRFYSNAFYDRPGFRETNGIEVYSVKATTNALKNEVANTHSRMRNRLETEGGALFCYINGKLVHRAGSSNVVLNDFVDLVYDGSVKAVHEFKISDLPGFYSDKDLKQKLLLHWSGVSNIIDYRDDTEIYVVKYSNDNVYSGVLYHRNMEDAVRMVTHKDYSIAVDYLSAYFRDHSWLGDAQDATIKLYIRNSGYDRPLVYEHNRIHELYKLPDEDVVDAMVGVDAVVPEWEASNLEKSGYVALMGHRGPNLPIELIKRAYGYNAVAKLIADTPQKKPTTGSYITLPPALCVNSTIFEYDREGLMIGWTPHRLGMYYTPRSQNCDMIEGFVGYGSQGLSTAYNPVNYRLVDGVGYRVYAQPISSGAPVGPWEDVTDNPAYYVVNDGVVDWVVGFNRYNVAIKNDVEIAVYDLELSYRDGINRFTINVDEVRTDGFGHLHHAEIPFGQFRIWMNGRSLIETVDYVIKWPEIVVYNKKYLSGTGTERFVFMGIGFCNRDMSMLPARDPGFVKHGRLSRNNQFDIRDDKVVRVVIDGCLYSKEELVYGEDPDGEVTVENVVNGSPYVVDDVFVPLRGFIEGDEQALREISMGVDKRVEDYLTLKLPEKVEDNPSMIPDLYPIYSPFASKITHDLAQGLLRMDDFTGHYTDQDVVDACEPYRWLLAYDPCLNDMVDTDYISIHPHNETRVITLDVHQWRFLRRAVYAFLRDRVTLSKFLRIESGFEHETDDHPHPYQVAP